MFVKLIYAPGKVLEYMYINCFLVLGVRRAAFHCDVFIISFLFRCMSLTAELTNGTFVGMRGCFSGAADNCNTSACNQKNESLSGPEYFARCVAECCTEENCNMNLFPMLAKPSSTVEVVSSSTVVSQNTTAQPDTTVSSTKRPISLGIKMRAFLHLPVFLLVTLDIMN